MSDTLPASEIIYRPVRYEDVRGLYDRVAQRLYAERDALISVRQVAKIWGVGVKTVRCWRADRDSRLPTPVQVPGHLVFRHIDVMVRWAQWNADETFRVLNTVQQTPEGEQ